MKKHVIGIVGCGKISDIYLKNLSNMFSNTTVGAVSDLVPERAEAKAKEYGIKKAYSAKEMMADEQIEIVLNLTIPSVHAEVALAAIRAGKHVYNEKPLAVTRAEGESILAEAEKNGVRVGCAPDTFLGAGLQTARAAIDSGMIGRPVAATAFMLGHGPEKWHPDPEFFYKTGGGPMFDMGPYYLTALVSLIGPINAVAGIARKGLEQRTVGSGIKEGQVITVDIPTHIAGLIDFHGGAVGTIITSFDVWANNLPRIEIHGTLGSLSVPDPNTFGGSVKIKRENDTEWEELPYTHGHSENSRGIGVADLASSAEDGTPHRANGTVAYHVLDVMHAFHDASDQRRHVEISSKCERPAPLPTMADTAALQF
ncbi:MAG: gfo/Idh/MocA family oxidoreductase [Spirochaetaceae bacterium]|nr:MAG: gfo/Idh/MocA family oxidoreductase [Spirochaetaceae bacterium]